MTRPESPLGSPQHLVWSDHELPTEFQLETAMAMMMKHKSLQPFGMFSCAWPFQLHGVSWTEGGGGDEEHAGESDTCYTGWVREDTWWDNTGKKEAKADVGESWHHGEERLEDKNRDINCLWPHPHPICPPCSPGRHWETSPINKLWTDEGIRWTLLWKPSTTEGLSVYLCPEERGGARCRPAQKHSQDVPQNKSRTLKVGFCGKVVNNICLWTDSVKKFYSDQTSWWWSWAQASMGWCLETILVQKKKKNAVHANAIL